MSFISSILNPGSGAGFSAVNADTKIGPANDLVNSGINQQQAFVNALQGQNGLGNQASVFQQQQGLANQLQGVANGTGPNPALAQLQQTTGQNVANQGALMAGQRGSGANVGLMARLAAQQGANVQQQAVGQGATLGAQQQLAGMQLLQNQQAGLGNMANAQVGQQQAGLNALNQNSLQNQSNIMGLQANANSANAGVAGANAQAQAGLLGGLLGGAGSALSSIKFADGGMVGNYADGGVAGNPLMQPMAQTAVTDPTQGPQSAVGKMLSGFDSGMSQMSGQNTGAQQLNKGANQLSGGIASALGNMFKPSAPNYNGMQMAGGPMDQAPGMEPMTMNAAHGGPVVGEALAQQGRRVPGHAAVAGDSLKNDTVPARLSPGEIVIPRHIATGPNAPMEAAKFVHQVLQKEKMACGGQVSFADGGQANNPPPMPDPQKARDADPNLPEHGQSFSKGWENLKNEIGLGTTSPQNKYQGGPVQNFDDGGMANNIVPDYASTPVDELAMPQDRPAGFSDLPGTKFFKKVWEERPGNGTLFNRPEDQKGVVSMNMDPQNVEGKSPDNSKFDLSGFKQPASGGMSQGPYGKYDPNAGIDLQKKGLEKEADYQNKMNESSKQPLQDLNNQLTRMTAMTQQNAWNHNLDQEKVINDIQNGHIDANAYLNNMGAGQKVSTAIGLILGGMGGGLMHQENPAMKFIQGQIANDVKAQEVNINNKHNLLNALEKQYGDKQTALQSLYNIYSLKYENQMKQAAAESGSQLVNARLLQGLGPLEQQRQQNNLQMGMRTTALQHINSGGDASGVIPFLVPEQQRTKALEQYGKINELNQLQDSMRRSADHLHGKFLNGVLSPNDTNSAKQSFAGAIQKISEGRYNGEAAQQLVNSFLPQGTDLGKETFQNKQKRMDEFFEAFRKEPETFLHALSVPTPKVSPRGQAVKQGIK